MRRAARIDANKLAIVAALRAAGCTVFDLKQPTDLLCGYRGKTLLIECKNGALSPSRRKLTPLQQSFMQDWRGGPVATVTDVDGALRAIALL